MTQLKDAPALRALRPRRTTMAQVAKASGVARSTVSGILSNRADCLVSPATKERVLNTVRQMGYRPNLSARTLVNGRSMMIGVSGVGLYVEVTTATYVAFEQAARSQGYLSLIADNPNDPATEDRFIQWMTDRNVDGLLVCPTETGEHRELRRLAESGFPVVTVDGDGRVDFPIDDVSVDYAAGGALQAEHLLSLGRRRVCIANSAHSCHVVDERMRGLEEALVAAGCERPVRMNVNFEASPEGVMLGWSDAERAQVCRFIAAHERRFDAIVGVGDNMAVLVCAAVRELGLDVPRQVAVVGFDGNSMSQLPMMPITTVVNPAVRVGQTAFELMMRRMRGDAGLGHERVKIKPTLAVRASTVGRDGQRARNF